MVLLEKLANLRYFAAFCNERGSPRSYRSGKKNGRMGVSIGRIAPVGPFVGYGFSSERLGVLYRGPLSGSRASEDKSSYGPAISAGRDSDGMRTCWRLGSESSRSDEVLNVLLSGER